MQELTWHDSRVDPCTEPAFMSIAAVMQSLKSRYPFSRSSSECTIPLDIVKVNYCSWAAYSLHLAYLWLG